MSTLLPGHFDGALKELSLYHLAIIDTSHYVRLFNRYAESIKTELLIRNMETEAACSWCITETVKRAFPEITVLNHELNDRFESIYDVYFLGEENDIRRKLLPYLQFQTQLKAFKVLPLLDKTIIAIGT